MACCPNGNECNHIITLGYLKSFIGENVKDSNGNVKHVTSSKGDDYCPTYSELTGGSLIPNFVDGGSGKWSLNVDGITVNGSYQSNQCVMQQDLVLTYTRFDSLTITATPATNIDACSGASTMSYTYKLKKTVKSMNGSCSVGETSSTDNDTTNVIVYTSNKSWATISKPTVTISKNNPNNNGRSNARVATITGKITYKGEDKTATATITQNGLTGSYKFWYSDYTIHSRGVTCNNSGSSFDCYGGSYSAIAYYYQDDWDVYRWQDKCGVYYNSDTQKRNERYDTYHEYDRYSGSFSNKVGQCGTWPDSKSWDGYGSCSWTQTCDKCDCEPYYEYRTTSAASKSVGCNGGSVSFTANVPYTYHDRHKDESGFCIDNTSEGTSAHTISVDVGSNAGNTSSRTITGTKEFISYRITQSGGCTVKSVTSYTDVYAACEGGTNITGETIRTVATTGGCCATSSTTSRVSVNIGNLECNSGETRLILDKGDYKIYQLGRADCCTEPCKCTDLVVSGDKTIESDANTNIEIGTYTAGCVTGIAASESVDWVTSISASGGSIKATVTENTSTTSARTATITVTGKAGSDTCTKTFTLTQKAKATACTCDDLVVSGDKTIESDAATLVIGTYTAGCITNIAALESVDWITSIVAINGNIAVTVTENTSTESARTATITVTGKAGSDTCTKTFTLTQKAKATACTCDDLAVTGTTEVPYYGGEIVVATYTADSCITNIGLTANPDCITNINVDYPNKGDISGLVGKYDGSRDINVTVTGKAGTETCSKEFVLKQIKPVTTCYRGTDNGTDVRERPVLFCGTSSTSGTIPFVERYDSILVPGGLQYYSGAAEPTETSPWYDLTSSFVNIAPWVQMRYSNNASTVCHPEYGGVHIKVTDFEYIGQSVRSVNFWFRSKNRSLTKMTSCDGTEYDLCKQWQYEIRQCAKGYYWCGTSSSNCIAVECGSSDCHMGKYSDVPCDCDSPTPTTCTYTVKSNVEGATVTWSGGTMGTTKTTTIVGGTSSISIPCAGTIRATLTKEGCTFDGSNVKVSEGKTVTINGTCSGPTPTTCTYTVKSNVEGATVTWSGGTMGTTKTTTIVGYTSSISIPCAGTIRATLTKEGCTFDGSNVKVSEGKTVTINGTCSGPTPTCTCSSSNFSVTGETNISPGVNVVVATYTANCINNAEVRYMSGDDFLHSLTFMNGSIVMDKLNVHQNDLIGTYAIYINGEKCTDEFMVKSPGSLVCDCKSVNMTTTSVTFDASGGTKTIGSITNGCTLNPLSTFSWGKLYQDGTSIKVSADTYSSTTGRGTGITYNVIGGTQNSCGTISIAQSGAPTTYNISIYGEQAGSASGVKVYLDYTASPTLPSGAHFQFEDGCTLRIKYWNCNGNTEYPIVPNNHVVPNCTPGSGREYAIESGTRVHMETLSVNFSLFGETHHLTSGGSGTYTNQGNTYIVTVQ